MKILRYILQIILAWYEGKFKREEPQDGRGQSSDAIVDIETNQSDNDGPEYDLEEVEHVPEPIEPRIDSAQKYFWILDPGHGK
ncbi:MAG: hypothetical protein AAFY91_15205, partial [Bacteroidota bacterium]